MRISNWTALGLLAGMSSCSLALTTQAPIAPVAVASAPAASAAATTPAQSPVGEAGLS
jgi:hypothetical protein